MEMAAAARTHKYGAHSDMTSSHIHGIIISSVVANVIENEAQIHHFLLFLIRIVFFRLAFILENDRGWCHPLTPWKQLQGNNILVDSSVEVLKTLDENLVGDRRV